MHITLTCNIFNNHDCFEPCRLFNMYVLSKCYMKQLYCSMYTYNVYKWLHKLNFAQALLAWPLHQKLWNHCFRSLTTYKFDTQIPIIIIIITLNSRRNRMSNVRCYCLVCNSDNSQIQSGVKVPLNHVKVLSVNWKSLFLLLLLLLLLCFRRLGGRRIVSRIICYMSSVFFWVTSPCGLKWSRPMRGLHSDMSKNRIL